jgi:hypothetical protein
MVGEPLPEFSSDDPNADPQAAREKCWQRKIVRVDLPRQIPLPVRQHPYLVLTNGMDDPLLELTLQLSNNELMSAAIDGLDGTGSAPHRIGGWLQSGATPEQFSAELVSIFRVNTARFTTAKYFRAADRRVLALLRHVAGDAKVIRQVASLNRWIYLDMQGALSQLVQIDEELQALRLTCSEWDRMQRGEAIHRTSAQWLGEILRTTPQPRPSRPTSELYGPLEHAVDEALRASRKMPERFTAVRDQSAYAVLSMLHPGFEQRPAVIEILERHAPSDEPADPMRFLVPQLVKILDPANSRLA